MTRCASVVKCTVPRSLRFGVVAFDTACAKVYTTADSGEDPRKGWLDKGRWPSYKRSSPQMFTISALRRICAGENAVLQPSSRSLLVAAPFRLRKSVLDGLSNNADTRVASYSRPRAL